MDANWIILRMEAMVGDDMRLPKGKSLIFILVIKHSLLLVWFEMIARFQESLACIENIQWP